MLLMSDGRIYNGPIRPGIQSEMSGSGIAIDLDRDNDFFVVEIKRQYRNGA